MLSRRLLPALVLALLAPVLVACGGDDDGDTTLTVYAAASLKKTFEQLKADFEETHDGVTVELVLGGSSDLVSQIQGGAGADVFASADTANMDKLVGSDDQGQDPQDFATNTLEIATPPDNPAGVATLQDLAGPDVDLVLCAPEVPCGAAAQKVADAAGLTFDPVSEEQSVTDVLGKITSGQADAGLVYVTDVLAAGDTVKGIEFPESSSAVNTYPITTVKGSDHADLAGEFVDLVLSDKGQKVLADAGFGAP
ncbi:molybdate ABC transporter substrate-binding protein [Nocardioides rubriscoriae]|uniref:molybdate ABC transporter substrate-binding protein n=1 Tax=Nocardioides rubriscoriae TaxID=642762 RepID=UPI001B86A233|nr:molybdate ABC transporter substrate-binding protein [Nocardioides rubriscoriae]